MDINISKTLISGKNIAVIKTGNDDDNISVSIFPKRIEIKDNLTKETKTVSSLSLDELKIYTQSGNDTIHIENRTPIANPTLIRLFPGEDRDMVIGTKAHNVKANTNSEDLVIKENSLRSLEANKDKIKNFNEGARNHDSWFKSLKRNVVYFFGRDLKLRTPSAADIKKFVTEDLIDQQPIQGFKKYVSENLPTKPLDGFAEYVQNDVIGSRTVRNIHNYVVNDLFERPLEGLKEYFDKGKPAQGLRELDQKRNTYFTTQEDIAKIKEVAQPGDILLRFQEGYPLDKLFVGTWQHAGMYHEDGKVVDAMGNGTYQRTIEQFAESDGIVIIRPTHASQEQIDNMRSYAFEQIGKQYSVDFNDSSREQYCSGLVHNALKYAGIIPADYQKGEIIHPDKLMGLPNTEIVWTNRQDLVDKTIMDLEESVS